MNKQPFESDKELTNHIERMARTGRTGTLSEWNAFLATINRIMSSTNDAHKYQGETFINPTTLKYYNILVKYFEQSKGERIILIMDKKGNFARNKESIVKLFSEEEEIDFIISKLFFEKKILIARPRNGYYGITCVKEPTIEMAEELRVEANKFKANSKKNVDRVKKIEEESNLFK